MDRESGDLLRQHFQFFRIATLLILGACAISFGTTTPRAISLVELSWLPEESDRVRVLTSRPVACLVPAITSEAQAEIRFGEMAFNSPALLGGQAEKKGLSCGSCHQNGRGHATFQFEAISGEPGTADVTSGLFSKVRADNTFNPVPIPDLALPDGQDQVDRQDRVALAAFVRGQIEEEFSGDPPPEPVFEALLTYLQAIDRTGFNCIPAAREPRTWRQDWAEARLASDLMVATEDTTERAFYIRTGRIALRRLHERYAAAEDAPIRERLVLLSRDLADGIRLPVDTASLETRLEAASGRSLYSPSVLQEALRTSRN